MGQTPSRRKGLKKTWIGLHCKLVGEEGAVALDFVTEGEDRRWAESSKWKRRLRQLRAERKKQKRASNAERGRIDKGRNGKRGYLNFTQHQTKREKGAR